MTNEATLGVLMVLLLVVPATIWWAETSLEVYMNRKCGERFRVWLMDRASQIVSDETATPAARSVAIAWLAFVYDPWTLSEYAAPPAGGRQDTNPENDYGKYAPIIKEGFGHLAVLAMLENRRIGSAIRILVGDTRPDEAVRVIFHPLMRLATNPKWIVYERDRVDETLKVLERVPLGQDIVRSIWQRLRVPA